MPIAAINPDGTVKIYNSKTRQILDVKPDQLGQYNPALIGDYQKMQAQLSLSKSGALSVDKLAASNPQVAQMAMQQGAKTDAQIKKSQAIDTTKSSIQNLLDTFSGLAGYEKGPVSINAIPFLQSYTQGGEYEQQKKGLAATLKEVVGAGSGSGVRVTQSEINSWANLLPGIHKTQAQNKQDITLLNKQLTDKLGAGLDPEYLAQFGVGGGKPASQQGENTGLGGLIGNAGQDTKDILNSILNIPSQQIQQYQQAQQSPQAAVAWAQTHNPLAITEGLAKGAVNEANQALGEPLKGGDIIGRIGQRAYQKPVTTLLDVLPALQAGKAALGAKATEGAITAESGGNAIQKLLETRGKQLTQSTRNIDVGPSIYGVAREKAINDALDQLDIKGSAADQYAQLQPKMAQLGDSIEKTLNENPKQIPVQNIVDDFQKNLADQLRTKNLSSKAAKQEAVGYMQDVYGGKLGSTIDSPTLFKLKQKINQDYQGVAKKLERGTPLNDREKVIATARQTIDDVIADKHPEVKQATLLQSKLYDAADSLYKQRSATGPGIKAFGLKAGIPGSVYQKGKNFVGGKMQTAAQMQLSPLLQAALQTPKTAAQSAYAIIQGGRLLHQQ